MMSSETTASHFACVARRAGTQGGNSPQDCNWLFCGCDPLTDKVIAALQECGWTAPHPKHRRTFPFACDLCQQPINSVDDFDWHGLGNCVEICESCWGSGTPEAAIACARCEGTGHYSTLPSCAKACSICNGTGKIGGSPRAWIEAKERLPQPMRMVIAWHPKWPHSFIAHIDEQGEWQGHYLENPNLPEDDPIFWREIPEPPQWLKRSINKEANNA